MSRNDPGHRNTLFAHKVSWTVDESRKLEYTGAAGYFVDMLLLFAIFLILHMRIAQKDEIIYFQNGNFMIR